MAKDGKKIEAGEKNFNINVNVENKEKWKKGGGHFWMFGSALAMVLSYAHNSSILWAIVHGILSWLYILYKIFI